MSSFLMKQWKVTFLCQPHDFLALTLHSKAWQYSSFFPPWATQSTDPKKKSIKKCLFIWKSKAEIPGISLKSWKGLVKFYSFSYKHKTSAYRVLQYRLQPFALLTMTGNMKQHRQNSDFCWDSASQKPLSATAENPQMLKLNKRAIEDTPEKTYNNWDNLGIKRKLLLLDLEYLQLKYYSLKKATWEVSSLSRTENIISLTYQSSTEAVDVPPVIKMCFTIPRFTNHGKNNNFLANNKTKSRSTIPQRYAYAREKSRQDQEKEVNFFFLDYSWVNLICQQE